MACHNYSTELIEPRANVQSWALFKSHMPNLYPHPTNKVGRLYPEFFPSFNFFLGGGRENCKILFKGCTVLWGQPEITQNNKNYIIVPRTFALDCSLSLTSKIPAPNFGEISDCASGKPRDKWSELTKIAALNLPQCSQTQQLIQFLTLLPTKKLLFCNFYATIIVLFANWKRTKQIRRISFNLFLSVVGFYRLVIIALR